MWPEVEAVLRRAVDDGVVPGAALCVGTRDGQRWSSALGCAELRPLRRPVAPGLAWDLASLTKVLCTTSVAMRLVEEGRLDLDRPVCAWVPEAPPGVTAAHLLQHGSGLPAWGPLHERVDAAGLAWGSPAARASMVEAALAPGLEAAPGQRHRYSDLGFLLLGAVLEAVGGERIDRLFERLVRRHSGADLRWGWPGAAATEDCPRRGRVLVGEVHDLNAAAMGGLAPHAGLFGTPEAVAAHGLWLLRAWDGVGEGLSAGTVRRFWSSVGPGSHRLGWDGVTPGGSSAGPRWPLDGVGHLAFTGCSLWIAPRQGAVVALCTNRVHPVIEGGAVPSAPVSPRLAAFKRLRPAVHTAVVAGLEAEGRWQP
jgi:CubicO group peptidase (beta-lactamase class C family)